MFTLIFGFILFLLASFFCFTIPGLAILSGSRKEFSDPEKITLGTVLGFVFFTLLSYLLYVFRIHILLLFIIALINFYFLESHFFIPEFSFSINKRVTLLIVVFIIGIIGQLAIIAPSGLNIGGNLLFWSANGHDGAWHIALSQEIAKGYPFQNPIFAGEKLVNYHFFSDISLSDFNKEFKISDFDLYFRFFPFLFSLLLGSTAFILGSRFGGSFTVGLWSVIFTYFAGSWGYIVTWLRNKTIGGESIFWGTQIQSSTGNPPQIVSDFLLLSFLILFLVYLQKKSRTLFAACFLIAGTMVLFKVYVAVAVLGSLGIVGLWQVIRERKFHILGLSILSGILSAILYLPNSAGAGSFLIFEPWWYIRTMVVIDSRLNWIDMELRRQTYMADHNYKRVVQLEVTAFLIFFFGNLGMRFIGLFSLFKTAITTHKNYFNLTFLLIILISLVFPLLFLQRGVAGNTSQFFQYFILLFGILAAVSTAQLFKLVKNKLMIGLISLFIIVLAVPTQLGLINEFYSRPAFARINKYEIDALNFLKNKSPLQSVIMSPPYDQYLDLKEVTPNIWDWFDTAYVAALSGRRTYFADYEQVDIMGYDYKQRLSLEQQVFQETSSLTASQMLKGRNINFLYFPKQLAPKFLPQPGFEVVYQNEGAEVWKVNP